METITTNKQAEKGEYYEAWERALSDSTIIGLNYCAQDNEWYIDTRSRDQTGRSKVFGSLGAQTDDINGRVRVPDEVIRRRMTEQKNLRLVNAADNLDYSKLSDPLSGEGLVPVIAVDSARLAADGVSAIRMVGFANREAMSRTLETGLATFYSRSSGAIWTKGEQSGNTLSVLGVFADCDLDTVVLSAEPTGPTCHTGANSCFEVQDVGE